MAIKRDGHHMLKGEIKTKKKTNKLYFVSIITWYYLLCQWLFCGCLPKYISLDLSHCIYQVQCRSWCMLSFLVFADLCSIETASPLQCLPHHKNSAWLCLNLQSLWRSILQSVWVCIVLPCYLLPNLLTLLWQDLHTALRSHKHSSPICQYEMWCISLAHVWQSFIWAWHLPCTSSNFACLNLCQLV